MTNDLENTKFYAFALPQMSSYQIIQGQRSRTGVVWPHHNLFHFIISLSSILWEELGERKMLKFHKIIIKF